jgi:hypothetical protein
LQVVSLLNLLVEAT